MQIEMNRRGNVPPGWWPLPVPQERSCPTLHVTVISANALVAWAVKESLEAEADVFSCRVISGSDLRHPTFPPQTDVALIAPQSWEEMGRWLPPLQSRTTCRRWLIAADLRVIGMFLSALEM